MNMTDFKVKYPDLYAAIFEDGKKEGLAEGLSQGEASGLEKGKAEAQAEAKADGAKVERERIQNVEAQSIPGHEELIQTLRFDGKTSGPEAAVQILSAEKTLRQTTLTQLDTDAAKPVAHIAAPDVEVTAVDDPDMPVKDRAKAAWDKNAKLHGEFGSLEAYVAFCEAEASGRAKILGAK